MVEIVEKIPKKKATMLQVPKERPRLTGSVGEEKIKYSMLSVHPGLNRKLLQKCRIDIKRQDYGLHNEEVEEKIEETNEEKNLFMRFAGKKPLTVVTDDFKEINPNQILKTTIDVMGSAPTIRYFKNNESLQFNFPIESRFNGMNLAVNTGPYGIYGGSGQNAIKYGIAWFNEACANWTVFLEKTLNKGLGRVVHTGNISLDQRLEVLPGIVEELTGKIEESNDKRFSYEELQDYFVIYQRRGLNKKFAQQIIAENTRGISAYDLSYRLTELCQDEKLSDTSRAKIEYLAGEVILCFDDIKHKLEDHPVVSGHVRTQLDLPKQYISMN